VVAMTPRRLHPLGPLVLLCAGPRLRPTQPPLLAGADIAQMMKEIGAKQVTQEMIDKAKAEAKEKPLDPVQVLKQGGLNVNEDLARRIEASPDKVKEAKEETIAEATALAMYQQVRCDGCKAIAELLAADLVSSWRPKWTRESFLERTQSFCESPGFPGDYQVVAGAESKDGDPQQEVYKLEKSTQQLVTTKHSAMALARICREHVDEHDTKAAKEASIAVNRALKEVGDTSKLQDMFRQTPTPSGDLQHTLEGLLCKRVCKGKQRRRSRGEAEL